MDICGKFLNRYAVGAKFNHVLLQHSLAQRKHLLQKKKIAASFFSTL